MRRFTEFWATAIFIVSSAPAVGCSNVEEASVGRRSEAIWGGVVASEAEYEAVMCGPRYGGVPCPPYPAGWDGCTWRCEMNTTLITPNIAVTAAWDQRVGGQDGWWPLGLATRAGGVPLETPTPHRTGFGSVLAWTPSLPPIRSPARTRTGDRFIIGTR
jgi:hypothetical protein